MELLNQFLDLMLHLDKYLGAFINNYGTLTYFVLFLIIICETGLVVTPFLPGDSLIFAAGTFAAIGSLNIFILILVLGIAAIAGDTINYHIGKYFGAKALSLGNGKLIKKEHIDKTNSYFDKYGGKTIIIARFIPIVRTCAPFVAGIGEMKYKEFILYNSIGGALWVTVAALAGYFFGNISFVANNFTVVILAIILISLLPAVYEVVMAKIKSKAKDEAECQE